MGIKLKISKSPIDSEMVQITSESNGNTFLWCVAHVDILHGSMMYDMMKELGEVDVYLTHHDPDKIIPDRGIGF